MTLFPDVRKYQGPPKIKYNRLRTTYAIQKLLQLISIKPKALFSSGSRLDACRNAVGAGCGHG
jgi:hypothetical protein